ncbi:MAG TPA: exo-beta-N-acetylmuramidase NamZ domain-containing protein, partial [Hyphomicrobiaceae bacterium]|nr:exo-beta-N-acetylmuramidase NamZ domain-containing protein [Hyphomicrobiaceae bacterium]
MPAIADVPPRPVTAGAEVLAATQFAMLAGQRVALIANQTSLAYGEHVADLLHRAPGVKLAAILAPEHGFRGSAEAGASVGHASDEKTGAPIYSLYGRSKKPTPSMLRDVDVLLFDVQDIGTRFYTYISTLGLAMQAAAAARIPFIVLDSPNPLGGEYVSGFVL